MTRATVLAALAAMAVALAAPAAGQTLQERIDYVRSRQQRSVRDQEQLGRPIKERLRDVIGHVLIQGANLRQSLEWWSRTTQVPLIVNWEQLESQGVDVSSPISIDLRFVPAGTALRMILQQVDAGAQTLMYESTPWYVQVMTKADANRNPVVRIYVVDDLLFEPPQFSNPPNFNLESVVGSRSAGRGGGGGTGAAGGSLFGDTSTRDDRDSRKTKAERGEELAQLVRDTIEPELWLEGPSSLRYFDGRLIVNAPLYVHRQIGTPSTGALGARPGGYTVAPRSNMRANTGPTSNVRPTGSDVAGVAPIPRQDISGKR